MLSRDSRHCWPAEACARCGEKLRHDLHLRMCPKRDRVKQTSSFKHRPRTAEELKIVRATCKACPHRTEGGGEYDAGLCKLKLAGCSKCGSIEKFLAFQKSGKPCPDKPPRFDGTPLIE